MSPVGAVRVENNNRKEPVLWKMVRKVSHVEVVFELRPHIRQ